MTQAAIIYQWMSSLSEQPWDSVDYTEILDSYNLIQNIMEL